MQETEAPTNWINKAALYEILALAFNYTSQELAVALTSGEYHEALVEIIAATGIGHSPACGDAPELTETLRELDDYRGRNAEEVHHELRIEHTWLFVGSPNPVVSPFAGVWLAEELGVEPLLFVNKEAMAVERFMRSCGVGQPQGKNEPLDAIGAELEFLQYLCLVQAKAVQLPEGVTLPENAYEQFYSQHFAGFAKKFATKTIASSRIPFFKAAAQILAALPEEPL